jgi:hypothetical protein
MHLWISIASMNFGVHGFPPRVVPVIVGMMPPSNNAG